MSVSVPHKWTRSFSLGNPKLSIKDVDIFRSLSTNQFFDGSSPRKKVKEAKKEVIFTKKKTFMISTKYSAKLMDYLSINYIKMS